MKKAGWKQQKLKILLRGMNLKKDLPLQDQGGEKFAPPHYCFFHNFFSNKIIKKPDIENFFRWTMNVLRPLRSIFIYWGEGGQE